MSMTRTFDIYMDVLLGRPVPGFTTSCFISRVAESGQVHEVSMSDDRKSWWTNKLNGTQRIVMDHELLTEDVLLESDLVHQSTEKTYDFSPPFVNNFCLIDDGSSIGINSQNAKFYVGATHVVEEGDSLYFLYLVSKDKEIRLIENIRKYDHLDKSKGFISVPYLFFSYLNSCKTIGFEKWPTTLKIKKHGVDRIKLDSVIYISKNMTSFKSPLSSLKVEWKTHWWVRGHWVTLNPKSIGKNRQGNREVLGKTWRTEHVKGNLEGPLKKQLRVLQKDDDGELRT